MKKETIKAKDLNRKFDENEEDIVQYFDRENVRRLGWEPKRVNVNFPVWMIRELDREAQRLNISRQAVIKSWIGEMLRSERQSLVQ